MRPTNLSEDIAVVSHIVPSAARNTGSYVGAAVDATNFERLVARLHIGTLAGTGTATMKFQHSSVSASSAAAWADVSSASCITSAFASTSNGKIGQLELRADQYSALNRYIRPYVEIATSNGWVGCVEVTGEPILKPATGFDTADVVQTVVY
jgi:hypothetical protein